MQFQHTTPMPSGISLIAETEMIGVTQMATVGTESGLSETIIPGDASDTLSISLIQLLITWGDVTQTGKFEIHSKNNPPLVIFQDEPSGNIILPCNNVPIFLGDEGLTVLNNSTGGEYSITANYIIREL